jgi:hypothetical protein
LDDISDKFAPLTDDERAAARPKAAADNEWTIVIPAPANSLRPDVVWKVAGKWKKPNAVWPYRDGEGRSIEDRSIAIDLEWKLRTEQASRLRHTPRGLFTALQQKLCRWSGDNLDAAAASRPSIPGAGPPLHATPPYR